MSSSNPKARINIHKESYLTFHAWRSFDLIASLFAVMGIVTATIDYELNFSLSRTYNNCVASDRESDNYRVGTLLMSIIAILFMLLRHYYKFRWLSLLRQIENKTLLDLEMEQKITRKKYRVFIEIAVLCIFPYPNVDASIYIPLRYNEETITMCYKLSEFLYLIMITRFYFLLRAGTSFTIYQNEQARFCCERLGIRSGFFFSLKCLLKAHPIEVIFVIGFSSLFFAAVACRIFERPMDELTNTFYSDPLNYLWFLFETISTLGYGEYVPATYFARVVAVIAWLLGSIVLSLTIATLQNGTELDKNESLAYEKINSFHSAIGVMKMWMVYLRVKKQKSEGKQVRKSYQKLKIAAKAFKKNRMSNKADDPTAPKIDSSAFDAMVAREQIKDCMKQLSEIIEQFESENL
jgi:voltage-gated potassium channel Kch